MNTNHRHTRFTLLGLVALLVATLGIGVTASSVGAATGDPTVSVAVSATSVEAGTPVTFTVTVNGGDQLPQGRVTYTNPRTHSTINVANDAALRTADPNVFRYTPSLGDTGRNLIATFTIYVPASGHLVRPISTSVGFSVVNPVVGAVTVSRSSAVNDHCDHRTFYRNSQGLIYKVFIQCGAGSINWFRAIIYCSNGTGVGNWQNQPLPYYGSTATCPANGAESSTAVQFA